MDIKITMLKKIAMTAGLIFSVTLMTNTGCNSDKPKADTAAPVVSVEQKAETSTVAKENTEPAKDEYQIKKDKYALPSALSPRGESKVTEQTAKTETVKPSATKPSTAEKKPTMSKTARTVITQEELDAPLDEKTIKAITAWLNKEPGAVSPFKGDFYTHESLVTGQDKQNAHKYYLKIQGMDFGFFNTQEIWDKRSDAFKNEVLDIDTVKYAGMYTNADYNNTNFNRKGEIVGPVSGVQTGVRNIIAKGYTRKEIRDILLKDVSADVAKHYAQVRQFDPNKDLDWMDLCRPGPPPGLYHDFSGHPTPKRTLLSGNMFLKKSYEYVDKTDPSKKLSVNMFMHDQNLINKETYASFSSYIQFNQVLPPEKQDKAYREMCERLQKEYNEKGYSSIKLYTGNGRKGPNYDYEYSEARSKQLGEERPEYYKGYKAENFFMAYELPNDPNTWTTVRWSDVYNADSPDPWGDMYKVMAQINAKKPMVYKDKKSTTVYGIVDRPAEQYPRDGVGAQLMIVSQGKRPEIETCGGIVYKNGIPQGENIFIPEWPDSMQRWHNGQKVPLDKETQERIAKKTEEIKRLGGEDSLLMLKYTRHMQAQKAKEQQKKQQNQTPSNPEIDR